MTDPSSSSSTLSPSPSPTLSIYSSRRLNDIASRVIHQLRLQGHHHDDDPFPSADVQVHEKEEEFTFVCQPQYASPTPADQIFCDGRILPAYTYPVLVVERQEPGDGRKRGEGSRVTLGKFLMEERESSSSSSYYYSSEEEIEGAEPGSYCVWRAEGVKVQETRGKGRSSGGRRWRFRDYLVMKRSTSEGQKDKFVILRKGRGGGGGGWGEN